MFNMRLISCIDKFYYSEHRSCALIMLMIESSVHLGLCFCLLTENVNQDKLQIIMKTEITKGRKDRTFFCQAKNNKKMNSYFRFNSLYAIINIKHHPDPEAQEKMS